MNTGKTRPVEPQRKGDHYIRGITAEEIAREIAALSRDELLALRTKIEDHKKLAFEGIRNRFTDGTATPEWHRRALSACRIMGTQIAAIQDRISRLNTEHKATRHAEQRARFERTFMKVTYDFVGREKYEEIIEATRAQLKLTDPTSATGTDEGTDPKADRTADPT